MHHDDRRDRAPHEARREGTNDDAAPGERLARGGHVEGPIPVPRGGADHQPERRRCGEQAAEDLRAARRGRGAAQEQVGDLEALVARRCV